MAGTGESEGESSTVPHEKRVVLFGKTGAGKSTIANLLVTGGTEPVLFPSSDGAQACTREIHTESGRGWTVLDTIGLGEATSTASADTGITDETTPKEKLKAYLKEVRGKYSHIIYVMKAGRVTTIDEMIWCLFAEIFKGAEDAFVIVFTGKDADEEWIETERNQLPEEMKKVKDICVLNIPPKHKHTAIEAVNVGIRREQTEKFEAKLKDIFEKRNYESILPLISQVDPDDMDPIVESIFRKVVEKLKTLFARENWIAIAKLLFVVIEITGAVLGFGLSASSF